jgi:hypothetical protein
VRLVFYFKHDVSEIEFYLRLRVKLTQVGPADRATFCLRTQRLAPSVGPS